VTSFDEEFQAGSFASQADGRESPTRYGRMLGKRELDPNFNLGVADWLKAFAFSETSEKVTIACRLLASSEFPQTALSAKDLERIFVWSADISAVLADSLYLRGNWPEVWDYVLTLRTRLTVTFLAAEARVGMERFFRAIERTDLPLNENDLTAILAGVADENGWESVATEIVSFIGKHKGSRDVLPIESVARFFTLWGKSEVLATARRSGFGLQLSDRIELPEAV
jgi:hypothetical protein